MLWPSVNSVENNTPNLTSTALSVQADEIVEREFPNNDGFPALMVWHREGGLQDTVICS